MKIAHLLAAGLATLLLAACGTTTVRTTQSFASKYFGTLKFTGFKAVSDVSRTPSDLPGKLQQLVVTGLANAPQGKNPAEVEMHIVSYDVAAPSDRYLFGVFAGSNTMDVVVTVKDTSGTILERFDIERAVTHGSIDGAFTNPENELARDAAHGIVFALSGQTPADDQDSTFNFPR